MKTVIVNGQKKDVSTVSGCVRDRLSYEDVVFLAYGFTLDDKNPRPMPSVTYHHAADDRDGILTCGEAVEVVDGTVFNAVVTGNA